jgi:pyruvate dehydrogenase E1 component
VKNQLPVLAKIIKRAHYLATQMIYLANHRPDKEKGDPKIGGHVSASASSLHIMGALHLIVKSGFDHIANKPHASPTDHAYNYLLDLFLKPDLSKLSLEDCNTAMMGLRKYSKNGEPVFQSYHSTYDSDHHNFFPSGTVGIPPVNAGYLALAYRYAKDHGYDVPDAHFWALTGDSEFREGSMYEAVPDFAEREIGNLTWILDYNRQSLDGHRISNRSIMNGTDAQRVERSMLANGWEVLQVQHGSLRRALFAKPGGEAFRDFLENKLEDFEFQSLLLVQDVKTLKTGMAKEHPDLKKFLDGVKDQELYDALRDLGGHDLEALVEAMQTSKKSKRKPTLIIAHTLKGWGLKMAAASGNHSALLGEEEMQALRASQGLSGETLFARFDAATAEAKFLKERGDSLHKDIKAQRTLKNKNQDHFAKLISAHGALPPSLEISTKMASYPHTQWMLGQVTAKLTRIANTPWKNEAKELTAFEKSWKIPAELLVSMAPDVGTSTNLNPAMDGKVFGATVVDDFETELGVKDTKLPDLVPGQEASDRFLRFDIAECNVMSCVGSFGRLRDTLGIPIIPLMTVYDFFIKRALDQYFYNLYWKSGFILVGTPSGVTLSPEGAQHGWKSDIQIPNQITWEPFYCQELEWIMCDAIRRHVQYDDEGRNGVLIRGVTKGVEQKDFIARLKRQARFKTDPAVINLCPADLNISGAQVESEVASLADEEILKQVREEVLKGAYHLIDYRQYSGYEPGDNVIKIFAMGAMAAEAIKASDELLQKGIYADVVVVTSSDLLCGIQAHNNDYEYLKSLGVSADLHIHPMEQLNGHDLVLAAGRRVPIVSVHDGEAGLLDNLGSIVGVRQISLAVRKHSKCGRPPEIYHFHAIDAEAIVEATGKVLSETALENIQVSQTALRVKPEATENQAQDWKNLWPASSYQRRH